MEEEGRGAFKSGAKKTPKGRYAGIGVGGLVGAVSKDSGGGRR